MHHLGDYMHIMRTCMHACTHPQVRMYESVNFKEFVKLLSAFSKNASRDVRLEYMFQVYDVDGDGERTAIT